MTEFSTMLAFFSPETDYVYTFCADCGTPLSVNNHATKRPLCDDCKREALQESSRKKYVKRGAGMPRRYGDPTVDLVFAVINQALEDRDWQRKHPYDGEALNMADCGAQEFIEDGGVELWLAALGIGVRPSMSRQIRRTE